MRILGLLFGVVLLALIWRFRILFAPRVPAPAYPDPKKPGPQTAATCTEPALSGFVQGDLQVNNVNGGMYWGDRVVVGGQDNKLTTSLVVCAEQQLDIRGDIEIAPRAPGDPPISITLICHDGAVNIDAAAHIRMDSSGALGQPVRVNGLGQSAAGNNAGHLTIMGVTIVHAGSIEGPSGGTGGVAEVLPAAGTAPGAGTAVAVSGSGGAAGDVLFCAVEKTTLKSGSATFGGRGGAGGLATASPTQDANGYARAGDEGFSGNVRFEGRTPAGCMVLIEDSVLLTGGGIPVQPNGNARVERPGPANTNGDGGTSLAIGGAGSTGGRVLFDPACRVDGRGTIKSGDGGYGGAADAWGGNGESPQIAVADGSPGGRAEARGGQGGPTGQVPQWIDPAGQIQYGTKGNQGWGGDAAARGGDGGMGAPGKRGGTSGSARALGGSDGLGNAATPEDKAGVPAPPANPAWGGTGPAAGSRGAH